jgi:hypothetical protein
LGRLGPLVSYSALEKDKKESEWGERRSYWKRSSKMHGKEMISL